MIDLPTHIAHFFILGILYLFSPINS